MIELNLTYEESKKILELGYDFASVCDRFIEELSRLKKPEYIEQEYFQVTIFRTEINQRMSDSLIPIIPKTALEACLPELSGSTWLKNLRTNWMILDLDPHIIKLESIFKAFMWCHEHYPEELKKAFEEVMK